LNTDNIHHLAMLKNLLLWSEVHSDLLQRSAQVFRQRQQEDVTSQDNPLGGENAWPTQELTDSMWEPDMRRMLRNVVLHVSDISNPVKAFPLAKEWALRVLEEFFAQGDMEKANGLPVSPLNDRAKTNVPLSQVGFIEFFAAPLIFATIRILTPLEDRLKVLLDNVESWVSEWETEGTRTDEEKHQVRGRLRRLEEKGKAVIPEVKCLSDTVHAKRSSLRSLPQPERVGSNVSKTSASSSQPPSRWTWKGSGASKEPVSNFSEIEARPGPRAKSLNLAPSSAGASRRSQNR